MRVAAVIGHPVRHSLSPALHNAAFAAGGLDWTYVAFDVAPGGAAAALAAMRTLDLGGLSVTMPHKEDIAAAVDVLDPAAAALRSVNTVVWGSDGAAVGHRADGVGTLVGHDADGVGTLVGHSTDGDGFVASLAASEVDVTGRSIAVVGAGAAARSVVDALGRSGASDIAIVNRTADKAAAAAALSPAARVGDVEDVRAADIVVNATSVGMASTDLPFELTLLRGGQVVADLVYHPLETALLAAARSVGCTVVDGLGMLVHQAVLQQRLWTGIAPDPAPMRAAAESALASR